MADSSHTITDYGQTLRGRNMLVLVDGVPLNTNRDSSRNLANINPADIEQIEVLRGSSAIYGSGAAGGIISVRTKRPSGETKAETIVTGSAPLSQLQGAGLGAEVQHYLSGGGDVVDYSVSLGAKHVGGSFDAKGNALPPSPARETCSTPTSTTHRPRSASSWTQINGCSSPRATTTPARTPTMHPIRQWPACLQARLPPGLSGPGTCRPEPDQEHHAGS
jgi:iron complex outermembrane receptor protein